MLVCLFWRDWSWLQNLQRLSFCGSINCFGKLLDSNQSIIYNVGCWVSTMFVVLLGLLCSYTWNVFACEISWCEVQSIANRWQLSWQQAVLGLIQDGLSHVANGWVDNRGCLDWSAYVSWYFTWNSDSFMHTCWNSTRVGLVYLGYQLQGSS